MRAVAGVITVVATAGLLAAACGLPAPVEEVVADQTDNARRAAEDAVRDAAQDAAHDLADDAVGAVEDAAADLGPEGATQPRLQHVPFEPIPLDQAAGNDPLDPAMRELAQSIDRATLGDGGRVAAAVVCASEGSPARLYVGLSGMTPGAHEAVIDPPAGGRMMLQVRGDGSAHLLREASLDAPSYQITSTTLGVSLTVDGCAAHSPS